MSNNILAKRGDTVRTFTDRIRGARRGVVVSEVYTVAVNRVDLFTGERREHRQVVDVRWESGAVSTEHLNAVEVL